jgi:hypothetical protein
LAARYRCDEKPRGAVFRFISMGMAPRISYFHSLTLILSEDGIYLVPFWPFRFAHPPLLLPWSAAHPPLEIEGFFFFKTRALPLWVDTRFVEIDLPKKALEWIRARPDLLAQTPP